MTFHTKNHVVDGRIIGIVIEAKGLSLPRITKKKILKAVDAAMYVVIFLTILLSASVK